MRQFQRMFAGWIVIMIILSLLLTADPSILGIGGRSYFVIDLLASIYLVGLMFVVSIVCTAGVSLIVWVPLGYGIGWVVFRLLGWDKQKTAAPAVNISRQDSDMSNQDAAALLNYVTKARAKGLSDEQMRLKLEDNSWTTDEVQWALSTLKK